MAKIQQLMANLLLLNSIPKQVTNLLIRENHAAFTNTHGRVLGVVDLSESFKIPKGTHKVVYGHLRLVDNA